MADVNVKLKAAALPKEATPQKSWGASFETSSGFSIKFPQSHWMAFFVDLGFAKGKFEDRNKFLDKYRIIAHSVTELGPAWDIWGEPTGPGQLGITVYTGKGKAIAAGTGKISKTTGDFSFSIATLYKGMTNKGKITV